jgi:hypothetical protein
MPSSFDPPRQANLVKVLMPNQAYLVLDTKAKDSRYQAKLWKFLVSSQAQTVLDAKPSSNWILDIKPSFGWGY